MSSNECDRNAAVRQTAMSSPASTSALENQQGETISSEADVSLQCDTLLFSPLQPGMILGQYRILKRLGVGGMGQVYKAVHPAMDRLVALKVLAPERLKDATARAHFQREMRNAARLIHPNIVVAHDAAEVGGLWFLVMEYVEGHDLAELLQRHGRPPIGLACEIIRQAAIGLQYAHELGMVHRDIKPANLMVADARPLPAGAKAAEGWIAAPLVKILDFGLSRMTAREGDGRAAGETITREGRLLGTPEYVSPEQIRDSQKVDIRSDIYSLGCTLYALLAGRPPFRGLSSLDIAIQHLSQLPEPVTRYCPDLPSPLSTVVHRMLAKRPEERIQTPGEVAAVLQPWTRLGATFGPVPATPALPATPASALPPAPLRSSGPTLSPAVVEIHFQALLRTFMLIIIIASIVAGGALCLPDIGNYVLQSWSKLTPHTSKTALPR